MIYAKKNLTDTIKMHLLQVSKNGALCAQVIQKTYMGL